MRRIQLAPAGRPTPTGGVAFGFNDYPDARSVRLQTETGMPLRRFKVPWSNVEAMRWSWNWSLYDAEYGRILPSWSETAAGRHRRPLDPAWTSLLSRPAGSPIRSGMVAVRPPPHGALSGGGGRRSLERAEHRPHVAAYPNPSRFAALLGLAYRAVKSVSSELRVVSGGLFSTNRSGSYGIADASFLAGLYRAGAGDEVDAIGAHPYPRIGGMF